LFEPFTINGITLPNRFVMPGMQRMWCDHGTPLPRLADYYRERVEGGVGLIITESCAVDHTSATQTPVFCRITDATLDAWARCFNAVNGAGGRMLMQLWHEGAIRKEGGDGPYAQYPTLSPSGLAHAGKPHGYLLDQFLWAETNRRTDGYGGDDMAARVRFPTEIVRAIRSAVGPEFIVSFRFSQWKEVNYKARVAATPQDLRVMLNAIRAAGADIIHASARYFWIPEWEGSDWGIAGWTKSMTDAPVIGVGSVGLDTDVMDNFFGKEANSTGEAGLSELLRRFNNREFDLISVGRGLIGDPHWVRKLRAGRFSEVRMFTKKDLLGDFELEGVVSEAHAGDH
jgi:2,4-dienoyl-CoA reductase-like NADH-dependent reductase (Old Yellow Enzyme family)